MVDISKIDEILANAKLSTMVPYGIYSLSSICHPKNGDFYYDEDTNIIKKWTVTSSNRSDYVIKLSVRKPKFKCRDACHTPSGIGIVLFASTVRCGDVSTFEYVLTSPYSIVVTYRFNEELITLAPWQHLAKYIVLGNSKLYWWIELIDRKYLLFKLTSDCKTISISEISRDRLNSYMTDGIPLVDRRSLSDIVIPSGASIDKL